MAASAVRTLEPRFGLGFQQGDCSRHGAPSLDNVAVFVASPGAGGRDRSGTTPRGSYVCISSRYSPGCKSFASKYAYKPRLPLGPEGCAYRNRPNSPFVPNGIILKIAGSTNRAEKALNFECCAGNGGDGGDGNEGGGKDGNGKKGGGGGRGDGGDEGFHSSDGDDFGRKEKGAVVSPHFNIFTRFWSRYLGLLESHPLIAKAITAGCINAFADLTCQIVFEKVKKIDVGRLAGFFSIGLFLVGPSLHFWYGSLGSIVPLKGTAGLVARLVLDQLLFSPISLGFFFAVLLTLEGRPHEIESKLKNDWWATVVAQWKLWVPFQTLNFAVVPPQLQVGVANLIGLVWTVYLSYAAHNDMAPNPKLATK